MDTPPTPLPFVQQPGPRMTLRTTSTPLDFFTLFFDDTIVQMLVDGTNTFAERTIAEKDRAGKLTPKSRWRKWRKVTANETKRVLSVIINMGVQGHHIYADQLYSSVPLVNELERRGTGYTGTLNKCRHQLPSVVRAKSFKMNIGETRAWRDGKKWFWLRGIRESQLL